MKISTRLRLNSLLPLILAAAIVVVFAVSLRVLNEATERQQQTQDLLNGLLELSLLTQSHVQQPLQRKLSQWRLEYLAIERILGGLAGAGEGAAIRQRLGENLNTLRELFEATAEQLGSEPAEGRTEQQQVLTQRLLSQLRIALRDVTSDALRLDLLVEQQVAGVTRTVALGVAFLAVILAGASMAAARRLNRTITDGVQELSHGAAILGSGDLSHRVKLEHDDELARLGDEFNRMAGHLQEITVTRDALAREVASRIRTEQELRQSEERFRRTIIDAPLPIAVHADDGEILQLNRAWAELSGAAANELPTLGSWRARVDTRPSDRFHEHVARSYLEHHQDEFRTTTADGNERIWHFTSSPLGALADGRRGAVTMALDVTERKRMEEAMRHQALHDALTGLPNRAFFHDLLQTSIARARRDGGRLAVLFLDLDRFKRINDSLGHEAGDQLLVAVAARLKAAVRESDAVARIGGDEFNILMTELHRDTDVVRVVLEILDGFRQPFVLHDQEVHAGTSIGIAMFPTDADSADKLLRNADTAMYHAKEMGRGCYQFFSPQMNARIIERVQIEADLRGAVAAGRMELHYQPQFDLTGRSLVGFEALLRWRHPYRGLLTPRGFLEVAEETGLLVSIGSWSLEAACREMLLWRQAFGLEVPVAVNLSSRQFNAPDLLPRTLDILDRTGLPPQWLELEITEETVMSNLDEALPRLEALTNAGVQLALDDFGTGRSSLHWLKMLPIHRLKIDRLFVRDIETDPDDRTIVQAVISLAHQMNMRVVAEGVETANQLDLLRREGCDEVQGNFLGHALPAERIRGMLEAGELGATRH